MKKNLKIFLSMVLIGALMAGPAYAQAEAGAAGTLSFLQEINKLGLRVDAELIDEEDDSDIKLIGVNLKPMSTPKRRKKLCGDVNFNGEVDIMDVLLVLRHANGTEELPQPATLVADVNEDGQITFLDGAIIFHYLTGRIESLPAPEFIYGDVNFDGEITARDALAILQHIEGINALSPEVLIVADVNGDWKTTALDARLILYYVVKGIESFPATEFIYGDVNFDGKITASDALLIARHTAGVKELSQEALLVADVNDDGKVTDLDARIIACYTVGIIDSFPATEFIYGDVNFDGEITPGDALLVMQHVKGIEVLSQGALIVADVNDDGKVDLVDSWYIYQGSMGQIDSFPVGGTEGILGNAIDYLNEIFNPTGYKLTDYVQVDGSVTFIFNLKENDSLISITVDLVTGEPRMDYTLQNAALETRRNIAERMGVDVSEVHLDGMKQWAYIHFPRNILFYDDVHTTLESETSTAGLLEEKIEHIWPPYPYPSTQYSVTAQVGNYTLTLDYSRQDYYPWYYYEQPMPLAGLDSIDIDSDAIYRSYPMPTITLKSFVDNRTGVDLVQKAANSLLELLNPGFSYHRGSVNVNSWAIKEDGLLHLDMSLSAGLKPYLYGGPYLNNYYWQPRILGMGISVTVDLETGIAAIDPKIVTAVKSVRDDISNSLEIPYDEVHVNSIWGGWEEIAIELDMPPVEMSILPGGCIIRKQTYILNASTEEFNLTYNYTITTDSTGSQDSSLELTSLVNKQTGQDLLRNAADHLRERLNSDDFELAYWGDGDDVIGFGFSLSDGSIVKIEVNIETGEAGMPEGFYGDVDRNGEVDIMDVLAAYLYTIGDKELSQASLLAADVNLDGAVDNADVKALYLYVIGDSTVPEIPIVADIGPIIIVGPIPEPASDEIDLKPIPLPMPGPSPMPMPDDPSTPVSTTISEGSGGTLDDDADIATTVDGSNGIADTVTVTVISVTDDSVDSSSGESKTEGTVATTRTINSEVLQMKAVEEKARMWSDDPRFVGEMAEEPTALPIQLEAQRDSQ